VVQVAVGPFLSLFWRRSGNLMVPGFAHALSDAVRNALGLIP
jgi:membrane protease YdiL (CAAX protease family)